MYPQPPLFLAQIRLGRTTCYSCVNHTIRVTLSRLTYIKAPCVTLFLCGFSKNGLEPENLTSWSQPRPLLPSSLKQTTTGLVEQLSVSVTEHPLVMVGGCSSSHVPRIILSLTIIRKHSHSTAKQGPAMPPAKGEGELLGWGPTCSLSSHQGCLLAIWPCLLQKFLSTAIPQSTAVCTPELQRPRLTAVLERKALGWELLGIPSAYGTSCSSDIQDIEDLQSQE